MGGTTSVSSGNAYAFGGSTRTLYFGKFTHSERITTNRPFRDTGWYHIVVVLIQHSSDFGTTERVKIYVNGKREYSFSTSGYPSSVEHGFRVNSTQGMLLGLVEMSSGK